MWKKILPLTFFGSFIAISCSNVVSCGLKQSQLPFDLNKWKNTWVFQSSNAQNIWQAIGNNKTGVVIKENPGIFLDEDSNPYDIKNLFEQFDIYGKRDENGKIKSNENYLETYLQLKYFVPNIIAYNQKLYNDVPLKKYENIMNNFDFEYSNDSENPPTKVIQKLEKEKKLPEEIQGPVSELIWNSTQAGETLNAYFSVLIKLKNTHLEIIDSKEYSVTEDGYYIDDEENNMEVELKFGIYFYLSTF